MRRPSQADPKPSDRLPRSCPTQGPTSIELRVYEADVPGHRDPAMSGCPLVTAFVCLTRRRPGTNRGGRATRGGNRLQGLSACQPLQAALRAGYPAGTDSSPIRMCFVSGRESLVQARRLISQTRFWVLRSKAGGTQCVWRRSTRRDVARAARIPGGARALDALRDGRRIRQDLGSQSHYPRLADAIAHGP